MTCDQFQLLGAYADGELPEPRAAAVRDHVAGCAGCAAELDELRAVGRLMAAARQSAFAEADGVRVDDVLARLHAHVRDLVETTDLSLLRLARIFSGVAASVLIAGLWLMSRPAPAPADAPAQASNVSVGVATVFAADPAHSADPAGVVGSAPEPNQAEPSARDRALEALFGEAGGQSAAGTGGGARGAAAAEVELP